MPKFVIQPRSEVFLPYEAAIAILDFASHVMNRQMLVTVNNYNNYASPGLISKVIEAG